jgi:hypothetical protein
VRRRASRGRRRPPSGRRSADDDAQRGIEERHGFPGALRTLGGWGPSRGPHVERRAPTRGS